MCIGQGHGHGALRKHQPIAIVRVDLQVIGDDLELVARHLEDFVVVNAHKAEPEGKMPGEKFRCYLRRRDRGRQIEFDSGLKMSPTELRAAEPRNPANNAASIAAGSLDFAPDDS